MTLPPSQRVQSWFWLLLAAGLVWLLIQLSPVLTPFLLAGLLAYMLNPGVEYLCRKRWPRWLSAAVMLVLLLLTMVLLALILIPILQKEIGLAVERIPALVEWFNRTLAPKLAQWFGWNIQWNPEAIKQLIANHWQENRENIVGQLFATGFATVRGGGSAVLTLFGILFLVPVVLFYLLLDWKPILQRFEALIPRRWHKKTMTMLREIDLLLAQYLRGQLLVMLVLALYYAVALKIAGIGIGIPVGLLTGLLIFIPYLGYALGLALALLAALLELNGGYGLLAVAVIYGVGQVLESLLLTPRLVGERIGLSPLAVLLALLAFGQLFGFFGVLLALPASAVLLVGLRHLRTAYLVSDFYKK